MRDSATTILEVENLTVGYGGRAVLQGVSFTVHARERVAVVGPNGAGKSTLFKCISGLLAPMAGSVRLGQPGGADGIQARRCGLWRRLPLVAYAPQREEVNWHFPATVFDVVAMARFPSYGLWRRPSAEDRAAVRRALEQVGLASLAERPVQELSGGQQQRVFLARALAQQARLVILDEPFNAVEQEAQQAIVAALSSLRERGVALLLSTHDLDFVAQSGWFDRVMVLNGRVLAYGRPEEVCRRERAGSGAQEALSAPVACLGGLAGGQQPVQAGEPEG